MHEPPPEVYESWPKPNYVDPENRGPGLTVSNAILLPVVLGVVWARCYTRIRITGSFGWDDVFIIAALIPCLGLMGVIIATDNFSIMNRHIWDTPADDVIFGLKSEFACALLYVWSSIFTKISVMIFCRRLLSPSHPGWYKGALDTIVYLTLVGTMAYTLVFFLSCQPLSAYWDNQPPFSTPDYSFHCIDISRIWLSGSILNLAWDVLTWLIPLPIVWKLHLPIKQRAAVMALFGVGVCVIVASLMKTYYIYKAFVVSYDITWEGWPNWICGGLETSLGIICASAPGLRPLISHFCPRPGVMFRNRYSYNQMSRGVDAPSPCDLEAHSVAMPLSPLSPTYSPTHPRVESIGSADDMKPWAYNSRSSSRNTSRRGSLSKIETGHIVSKPNGRATTPNTLSPGTPLSKRLTPVREIEPVSGIVTEDFKFNQTAALPPPDEDEMDGEPALPPESPAKAASPLWWRNRPRTASSPRKGTFAAERDRKGSVSSTGRKGSFSTVNSDKLERNTSLNSKKGKLKLDTDMAAAKAHGIADDTPVSALSATSPSTFRHTRKPSSSREFEAFNFNGPATSSRRDSTGAETILADSAPPPSYGEFVENNSWIRDDRTMGRRSIEPPPSHSEELHAI